MATKVTHVCGCTRDYPLQMPAEMTERMVADMQTRPCGFSDCPKREPQPQRILAATVEVNVNGHGRAD